jgi:hypothetical protein
MVMDVNEACGTGGITSFPPSIDDLLDLMMIIMYSEIMKEGDGR